LLSSADDEVPTVDATETQASVDTHPAARETDPLFSSAAQMRQGQAEGEARAKKQSRDNGRGRLASVDEATMAWTATHERSASPTQLVTSPPQITTPGDSFPFTSAHAASVPPANRRLSSLQTRRSSVSPRRSSTSQGRRPRALSRTQSGRDFLGLDEESSSSEDEDEEWVSNPFTLRTLLIPRRVCPSPADDNSPRRPRLACKPSFVVPDTS
jgi:hypothetical protein